MSSNQFTQPYSLLADEDLSAEQFHFVQPSNGGGGEVGLADSGAAAANVMGVLINDDASAAGDPASIQDRGITKLVTSAAVAFGAPLTNSATGEGVTATSGQPVWARALSASGGAGEIIKAQLLIGTEVVP